MMLGVGILGLIVVVLIFGGLLVGGSWAVRALFPGSVTSERRGGESPQELLEQRYARGELSRVDYETIRQDLQD